jgi:hypothetical protein
MWDKVAFKVYSVLQDGLFLWIVHFSPPKYIEFLLTKVSGGKALPTYFGANRGSQAQMFVGIWFPLYI